ncbi:MFS sugar transporter [Pleurostoma richardsiae]|uniref:MFS sugar transporter n=1 Tax=Pleurostoma richardsiae TaxID=41990 RepID=A0AA38R343_9PEZI|nr:MFS sugar transporter [Pleurostoma richardsiae]
MGSVKPQRGHHGNTKNALLASIGISMGGLLYGLDSGIIATTISQSSFKQYMYGGPKGDPALTGGIVSSYYAGSCIGGLQSGWLMDRWSRRYTVLMGAIVSIVGAALQAAAVNPGMIISGRILSGWSTGVLYSVTPVYLAEISPPENRGFLVGLKGLTNAIGFFLANWIGYAGSFAHGNAQWRIPLAMQAPPAAALGLLVVFMPFSPRWLVRQERHEDALAVLQRLHGARGDEFVQRQYTEIRDQLALEADIRKRSSLRVLFTPRYGRRLFLACLIVNMTKLSGSQIIQNYQSLMYAALGFKGQTVLLIAGCYGTMGVLGQIVNLAWVSDNWPRRRTMCVGCIVLAATLAVLTALSKFYPDDHNLAGSSAGVAFIFIFSFLYALFFNSTNWVLVSEIFPLHLRGTGVGFAIFTQAVTAIWLTQVSPIAFDSLKWRFYFIFIGTNIVAGLIYYFFLPETNQLTLEQVAAVFGDAAVEPKDTKDIDDKDHDEPETIEFRDKK